MFEKKHISLTLLLSGITAFSTNARNFVLKASAEAPNLIFIISDQLRFDALSCMGNKLISTPNMDRLAAEGVIFTRAYAQSPVSVPSRASMLTGNSLCNTGIWGNSYAYQNVTNSLLTGNEPIFSTKTYDEVLSENGYACEYYGKWHSPERKAYIYDNRPITCAGMTSHPVLGLGLKNNYMNWWKAGLNISIAPTQPGALSGAPGGLNYMPDALDARVIDPSLTKTVDYQNFGKQLIDAAFTESAMDAAHTIAAIERNKSKRFSIHCSFGPPHPPFVVSPPYYGSLNAANMPLPANYYVDNASSVFYRASELHSPYYSHSITKMGAYQNPATIGIMIARYYEMVKEIDDKLGEILRKLDETGLTEKTMIIFCGDHGEMLGSHGMNGKNNFYDESARVPLVIRYPAKIAAGTKVHVPVNLTDLRPTIEDYFNMPATKVDGKTLRPFIEDTYDKNETYFAVSEWYNDKIPGFMVRTNTHKLMFAHSAEASNKAIDGFYNLQTDSMEHINILKLANIPQVEKDKAQALKVLLIKWLKKVNSPYYYSVKARPLGRLGANYSLYQNDIAKIKIPGITHLTGLDAGASFKILPNDTLQILTSNNNVGYMGTTATISGANISLRFEVLPAFEISTSSPNTTQNISPSFDINYNNNSINIELHAPEAIKTKAQIFTLDSKLISDNELNTKFVSIDTHNFKSGYYLVRVIQGAESATKKIFIP